MISPVLTGAPPEFGQSPGKKKRVLLVDDSLSKRDLRAEVMRKLGVDVDCAADVSEARCWWRVDLYDLVLFNLGSSRGARDKFCSDIRTASPLQPIKFLVGKPEYLASSPADGDLPAAEDGDWADPPVPPLLAVRASSQQIWGIMEACRRISAIRSATDARSRAIRQRPAPPRDSEVRAVRRTSESPTLDDLLREELR
jgi:CheY-like chemotaxis protein